MRSGFRNEYAYALIIKEWIDGNGDTWFAGFALRSNEPYANEGAASFGEVVDSFGPLVKNNKYADWYKRRMVLSDDVWIDVNTNRVLRKKFLSNSKGGK